MGMTAGGQSCLDKQAVGPARLLASALVYACTDARRQAHRSCPVVAHVGLGGIQQGCQPKVLCVAAKTEPKKWSTAQVVLILALEQEASSVSKALALSSIGTQHAGLGQRAMSSHPHRKLGHHGLRPISRSHLYSDKRRGSVSRLFFRACAWVLHQAHV